MTLEYVLITPARNEAEFIERTIQSVIGQTVLPKRWLLVSDGSTDGTDEIVRRYMAERPWMHLVCLPERRDRSFAGKVQAFNAGYQQVQGLSFDVIGNLDADITIADPRLGVAGTHYVEGDFHSYRDSYIDVRHVNGGCQLFRRACFEEIGGYTPIKGGGIDWVAVTTARMKGWTTHSYAERIFNHHRKIGTAESNEMASQFRYGQKDYFLGGHPLWEVFRGVFQMTKKPYVVGGVLLLIGYFSSWMARTHRPVSPELIRFHQSEQLERLRALVLRRQQLGR
jgi:glycosyltransferase involved in cell wall biosynthesis